MVKNKDNKVILFYVSCAIFGISAGISGELWVFFLELGMMVLGVTILFTQGNNGCFTKQ